MQYNSVDFGKNKLKKIIVKAASTTGSTIVLRVNNANGPVIAKVKIPKSEVLNSVEASISEFYSGIQNIVAQLTDGDNVEIDWVSFK